MERLVVRLYLSLGISRTERRMSQKCAKPLRLVKFRVIINNFCILI